MEDCIFCQIVKGESPCYKIWEDDKHLAFLSIFPNTDGVTVLVTKDHHPSYYAEADDQVLTDLVLAAKKVAKILDDRFEDVGRTGWVIEGFGVNHLHIKLFPLHGTQDDQWKQHRSNIFAIYPRYPGFLSSNDGPRQSDEKLKEIADKLTK